MNEVIKWASIEDIRESFSRIEFEDATLEASGITVCYGNSEYYVDSSNRNTILYGGIRADVENYFSLPLLDSIIRAEESFIFVDKDLHIMYELEEIGALGGYHIQTIQSDIEESDFEELHAKLEQKIKEKIACFIIMDKEKENDQKWLERICKSVDKQDRVNCVLNVFSELPKIINLKELLSEIRIRNFRFYILGAEEKQLRSVYMQDYDGIKNKVENFVFQNSKDVDFVKEFSELCGYSYETGIKQQLIYMPELYRLKENEAVFLCGNSIPMKQSLLSWSQFNRMKEDAHMRKTALKTLSNEFEKLKEKFNLMEEELEQ